VRTLYAASDIIRLRFRSPHPSRQSLHVEQTCIFFLVLSQQRQFASCQQAWDWQGCGDLGRTLACHLRCTSTLFLLSERSSRRLIITNRHGSGNPTTSVCSHFRGCCRPSARGNLLEAYHLHLLAIATALLCTQLAHCSYGLLPRPLPSLRTSYYQVALRRPRPSRLALSLRLKGSCY
jgi:hypothetical protein